jgi:hypothetical protein
MKSRPLARLMLIVTAACLSPLHAGGSGKQKDAVIIRIHGETAQEEGDKFAVPVTLVDGRKTAVSIMPLLSEHDIASVYPFNAPDGSYGSYLKLDQHGANLLTQYSLERTGRNNVLAVMINGRHVIDVLVDKPVRDGIFCIPRGLTIVEAARLVNRFPVTGHEHDKAEKKKKPKFLPTDIMLPPKASDLKGAAGTPAP